MIVTENRLSVGRGKFCSKSCLNSFTHTGRKRSEETKRKIGDSHKGVKSVNWIGGKPKCGKCNKELDNRNAKFCFTHRVIRHKTGDKSHFWKGGITPLNMKIRHSIEYKLWRRSVLERDKNTCVWCGSTEKLHVDHIKRFSDYPELRFAIDNGRVLCVACHLTTDTYGNIKKNKL